MQKDFNKVNTKYFESELKTRKNHSSTAVHDNLVPMTESFKIIFAHEKKLTMR